MTNDAGHPHAGPVVFYRGFTRQFLDGKHGQSPSVPSCPSCLAQCYSVYHASAPDTTPAVAHTCLYLYKQHGSRTEPGQIYTITPDRNLGSTRCRASSLKDTHARTCTHTRARTHTHVHTRTNTHTDPCLVIDSAHTVGSTGTSAKLVASCTAAVDRVAAGKRVVVIDGVGYPAVGSIVGCSSADIVRASIF